jgi:hypothetical protein
MNMTNVIYIVGDKFSAFANNPNVITISEFEKTLHCPRIISTQPRIGNAKNVLYVWGQGVAVKPIETIQQLQKNKKTSEMIFQEITFAKESNAYVHKHLSENVIVSIPIAINEKLYLGKLMIDDCCSEMLDHTTGQHVQGMVLVEAARQMMLAVSERYFFSDQERFKSYFALLNMDIQFKQFTFPLEIDMHCNIIEYQKLSSGKFKAIFRVGFLQNNILTTQIDINVLVDKKDALQNNFYKDNFYTRNFLQA